MQISLLSFIYFIAFSHAFLLIVVLLKKTKSGEPGRILAVFIALFAYKLFEGGLTYSELYRQLPHFIDWLPGIALLLGPVFLAYVNRLSGRRDWTILQWFMHLSPTILLTLLIIPQQLVPAELKIARMDYFLSLEGPFKQPIASIALLITWKLHLGVYLFTAWRQLNRVVESSNAQFSDDTVIFQDWQKKLCLLMIALELIWVVLFVAEQTIGLSLLNDVGQSWLLFMAVIIFLMGYWGLQNPSLIVTPVEKEATTAEQFDEKTLGNKIEHSESAATAKIVKYSGAEMETETANAIKDAIIKKLDAEQLYLKPGLKLGELADAIGIRTHLISQVINQTMNTSFFKLVNGYRIEYAVALLKTEGDRFTLEQVAIESGFNNRVTFNKAFKEQLGVSASLYKKELKMAS